MYISLSANYSYIELGMKDLSVFDAFIRIYVMLLLEGTEKNQMLVRNFVAYVGIEA